MVQYECWISQHNVATDITNNDNGKNGNNNYGKKYSKHVYHIDR